MYTEVITTMTYRAEIGDDGLKPAEVSVDIDGAEIMEVLGERGALQCAATSAKAFLTSLHGTNPEMARQVIRALCESTGYYPVQPAPEPDPNEDMGG